MLCKGSTPQGVDLKGEAGGPGESRFNLFNIVKRDISTWAARKEYHVCMAEL